MSGALRGKGYLGVLLMAAGLEYEQTLEILDAVEAAAKSKGFEISVTRVDPNLSAMVK